MNNRTPTPPNQPLLSGASPQRPGGYGTRRLNNVPLYLLGGLAAVLMVVIVWVCFQRGQPPAHPREDEHGSSAVRYAQEMAAGRTGVIPPAAMAAGSPTPMPAAAAVMSLATPSPTPDEVEKQRRAALLAALNAKPGVEGGFDRIAQQRQKAQKPHELPPQSVAIIERQDPNNAKSALDVYRRQLSQAKGFPANPESPEGSGDADPDRWTLHSTLQRPQSPYVLQPGWTIPATLETAINSELPGMVRARVNADVYDTPSGQHLLIPSGSMLVGQYANKIAYGAKRVFFAFNRINFPDGAWLDLGAMPGVADDGTSGGSDQVDTHFWTTFGHALLMSVITAGVGLSQPHYGGGYDTVNATQELSAALGQNLGTAMSMLFEKDINRSPTIRLRPGLTFLVLVSRDVYFPGPYQRPSYTISN